MTPQQAYWLSIGWPEAPPKAGVGGPTGEALRREEESRRAQRDSQRQTTS